MRTREILTNITTQNCSKQFVVRYLKNKCRDYCMRRFSLISLVPLQTDFAFSLQSASFPSTIMRRDLALSYTLRLLSSFQIAVTKYAHHS